MILALTGTPGTGKTSVAETLKNKGYTIIDFTKVASENNCLIGKDIERDSFIVDLKKFDNYIKTNYTNSDIVIIDGHLSHLLKCSDKVILLRCIPTKLRQNLSKKGWKRKKIQENVEAEILDIILCEAVEQHSKDNIYEIDTSDKTIKEISENILEIIENSFKIMKKYKIGQIDWSEDILNQS